MTRMELLIGKLSQYNEKRLNYKIKKRTQKIWSSNSMYNVVIKDCIDQHW
jgi:hypothetical protein